MGGDTELLSPASQARRTHCSQSRKGASVLSNGHRVPYLPATRFYAGRRSRKSRLCCSGDLTGHLLQVPRWQQLVREQPRTLHQPGHLGVALIKESWSAEACGGAEKLAFSPAPSNDEKVYFLFRGCPWEPKSPRQLCCSQPEGSFN